MRTAALASGDASAASTKFGADVVASWELGTTMVLYFKSVVADAARRLSGDTMSTTAPVPLPFVSAVLRLMLVLSMCAGIAELRQVSKRLDLVRYVLVRLFARPSETFSAVPGAGQASAALSACLARRPSGGTGEGSGVPRGVRAADLAQLHPRDAFSLLRKCCAAGLVPPQCVLACNVSRCCGVGVTARVCAGECILRVVSVTQPSRADALVSAIMRQRGVDALLRLQHVSRERLAQFVQGLLSDATADTLRADSDDHDDADSPGHGMQVWHASNRKLFAFPELVVKPTAVAPGGL